MTKQEYFKYLLPLFIFAFALFFNVQTVESASLNIAPNNLVVNEGETFDLQVIVDSEDEVINAVESIIDYPTSLLRVVGVNTESSFIDVWLNPPSVSTEDGRIEFLGGIRNGINGNSLNVFNIRFRALESGMANLSFLTGDVTAADGEGSSVLSSMSGTSISITSIRPNVSQGLGLELIPEIEEEILSQEDKDSEDVFVPDSRVPDRPQVSIPLFTNQSGWYNHQDRFNVFWAVTEDIDKVAVELNKDPYFEPVNGFEDVCCGREFSSLDEGASFVHVRFLNEFGWSETYHHRIGIDNTSPLPIDVDIVKTGLNPEIEFETRDNVSGVKEYRVYVDNQDPIITDKSSIVLPTQSPGKHTLKVRAYDMAGNFTESSTTFNVLGLGTVGDLSEGIWIIVIITIFGIGSWLVFRVYNSS